MAYTSATDVREALTAEGTDQTGATAASLSDDALNDAIAEATSEIDARVSGAPFAEPEPAIISAIARDVAAYLATLTHRRGNPLAPEHPVALRYRRAQMLLDQAAAGKLDLTTDPESVGLVAHVENPYEGELFPLEALSLGVGDRYLPPWNDPRYYP
jgi:phage gp36-like protein